MSMVVKDASRCSWVLNNQWHHTLDNFGVTLVGEGNPIKMRENILVLSAELILKMLIFFLMQSAMTEDVVFQTDSVPGEIGEQLAVAELKRLVVLKASRNALKKHQAFISVMDEATSSSAKIYFGDLSSRTGAEAAL